MSERCSASTRSGALCRNRALPGLERCRLHASEPSPEQVEQLLGLLRSGAYPGVALAATGVSPDRELAGRLERARAQGELANVALIFQAARNGSWGAAAWLLERQYPERWAKVIRTPESLPEAPVELPAGDSLDELAGRRSRRREGFT